LDPFLFQALDRISLALVARREERVSLFHEFVEVSTSVWG
jgi:hypothetical protein